MAKKGETRKKMMLLNSQGLSGVPPARGEKGKKTGIEKKSVMEMFHFLTYQTRGYKIPLWNLII